MKRKRAVIGSRWHPGNCKHHDLRSGVYYEMNPLMRPADEIVQAALLAKAPANSRMPVWHWIFAGITILLLAAMTWPR